MYKQSNEPKLTGTIIRDNINKDLEDFLVSLLHGNVDLQNLFPYRKDEILRKLFGEGDKLEIEDYVRYLVGCQCGKLSIPSKYYSGNIKIGSWALFDADKICEDEYEYIFIPTYFIVCQLLVLSIFDQYSHLRLSRRINSLDKAIVDGIDFILWYFGDFKQDQRLQYLLPIIKEFCAKYVQGTVVNAKIDKAVEKLIAAVTVGIASCLENVDGIRSEIIEDFDKISDEFGDVVDTSVIKQDTSYSKLRKIAKELRDDSTGEDK